MSVESLRAHFSAYKVGVLDAPGVSLPVYTFEPDVGSNKFEELAYVGVGVDIALQEVVCGACMILGSWRSDLCKA